MTWLDFHPLDCSLVGRYPDPYVKISFIRFLGSNPFTELETKPTTPSALSGLRFFCNHVAEQQICIEYSLSRKVQKLPTVLPQEDIWKIINATDTLKHRLILMATYSARLRASEVIALKPKHIENKKMLIKVEKGKGGKEHYIASLVGPSYVLVIY